jgi:BON domain
MKMNRTLLKLMAWGGVGVLSAVIALEQDAPADPSQAQPAPQTQGPRTDGQIEMDVVHALDASPALKNDLITAATIQSEVTLSGTVSSDASKQLAEQIVSHVDGVTKVHNNLKVGNPGADGQNLPPADAGAQEMPDNGQPEPTPGLPPSGPSPDQQAQQAPPTQPAPSIAQNPPNQYPQQQPYPQQPYPPQGGYYPPPPQRPQYGNQQYQQPPQYQQAAGPVTIPQGTLMYLRTSEPVDSKRAKDGEPVQFTVIQDVAVGGVLAVPRGATVHGVITEAKNVGSGELAGSSSLALRLVSLDLGGRNYPLDSDQFKVKAPGKGGQTAGNVVGGALIGTIIGCAVGRGAGCAIGAGAGAAGGVAASAAEPGPRAWIPAEALVKFHLNTPVTVDPVSPQEAARLAEGLYPGGPNLYRRGPYGSPYYGYAAYPYGPYGYPAVYYRPYFMTGGYYYWR